MGCTYNIPNIRKNKIIGNFQTNISFEVFKNTISEVKKFNSVKTSAPYEVAGRA